MSPACPHNSHMLPVHSPVSHALPAHQPLGLSDTRLPLRSARVSLVDPVLHCLNSYFSLGCFKQANEQTGVTGQSQSCWSGDVGGTWALCGQHVWMTLLCCVSPQASRCSRGLRAAVYRRWTESKGQRGGTEAKTRRAECGRWRGAPVSEQRPERPMRGQEEGAEDV